MKTVLLLLGLFFSLTTIGQNGKRDFGSDWVSYNGGMGLSLGGALYDFNARQQLNELYGADFGPVVFHPLCFTFSPTLRFKSGNRLDSQFDLSFTGKRERVLDDSIPFFQYNGFHFGAAIGKEFFPNNYAFDLIFGAGINTGRYVLTEITPEEDEIWYNNPYFAPKLALEPRYSFGAISLSLRAEYASDLSRGRWKRSDGALNLANMNADGWFFLFTVEAVLEEGRQYLERQKEAALKL